MDVEPTADGGLLFLTGAGVRFAAPPRTRILAVAVAHESLPALRHRRLLLRTTRPAKLVVTLRAKRRTAVRPSCAHRHASRPFGCRRRSRPASTPPRFGPELEQARRRMTAWARPCRPAPAAQDRTRSTCIRRIRGIRHRRPQAPLCRRCRAKPHRRPLPQIQSDKSGLRCRARVRRRSRAVPVGGGRDPRTKRASLYPALPLPEAQIGPALQETSALERQAGRASPVRTTRGLTARATSLAQAVTEYSPQRDLPPAKRSCLRLHLGADCGRKQ